MKTVAVIDYGMCNIFSVEHACRYVGLNPVITSNRHEVMKADAVILPGVGAYGEAMENIRRKDLESPLKDFISGGKKFMGICLGMQLLFTESEEFGSHGGLKIIEGHVKRFSGHSGGKKVKVPQIAWNQIFPDPKNNLWACSPLQDLCQGEYMYFVHSYYPIPSDVSAVLSWSDYEGTGYCSGLLKDNIAAFQFHPEKSGKEGIKIYRRWAASIEKKESSK